MSPIALRDGPFEVDIYPAIGGILGRFSWRHPGGAIVDLLRTMHPAAIAAGDSEGAACFPLLPFSNRIRDSRFSFQGHAFDLPRNTSGSTIEHGHGWQRPWTVQTKTAASASIQFTHDPDRDPTWPFAYSAAQHIVLDPTGLSVTLRVHNLDHRLMPLGFGLHPYFPRTPHCRLQAKVSGFWETDAAVLPLHHRDIPSQFDLRPGLLMNDVVVDNVFTGFQGKATITWPERGTKLHMTADDPLRFLVVYVPDAATAASETAAGSAPYFCAEPVSNITDAFNLAGQNAGIDTGMISLAPGATISTNVHFRPESI